MVPMLKPMMVSVGVELFGMMTADLDVTELVKIDAIRAEIDAVLTQRLTMLTPAKVKFMMERVIREHLGWLVVWGNVFGGLIGILSWAAKY